MRVLIPYTYCDICHGTYEQRTEADESLTIKFTMNGKHKRLDLCPEHKDPTWSQIADNAIDDLDATQAPVPARPKTPKVPCEMCGKQIADSTVGRALHLSKAHADIPFEQRQAIAGTTVVGKQHPHRPATPVTPDQDTVLPGMVCPTCQRPGFKRSQSLANHLAQAHQITNKAERRELLDKAVTH